ncbi:MAG: hypothetical protein MR038_05325 [Oscillospiraceae bacterium]|nr:hypothetical protein [Oscillospiraceae bacterium]
MLKTKKRLLSAGIAVLVLISALIIALPAVRVSAAELWTSHAANDFAGGDGSSDAPFQISSAAELARMAVNINQNIGSGAYLSKYYKLTSDIDLSGYEWEPIGTSLYAFKGSFDGNGHKVKNLNISSGSNVGLFGCIGSGSCIKNVVIESGSITGSEKVGSICGFNNGGRIENCTNAAAVSGFSNVGGICGRNVGIVTDCKNLESGKVNGTAPTAEGLGSDIGGVCGYNQDYSTDKTDSYVINCYNYAEINNGSNAQYNNGVGGICGLNTGNIQNCYNLNIVRGNSKIGGVCGENQANIKQSSNKGDVTGTLGNVGGICGYSNQSTNLPDFVIDNCSNEGDVTCTYSDSSDCGVGGICGTSNIRISNCTNSGKVYSPSPIVGGICGEIDDSTIIGCSNSGEVSSWRWNVGGVCGINYNSTIEKSYNTGDVFVDAENVIWNSNYTSYVGGICGNNWGNFDDNEEKIISYSKIKNCYNTGKVSSPGYGAGGVCGYSASGMIEGCYNTGAVSGFGSVSGICGESQISIVKNCYNSGTSTGSYNIGGVSGYNWFSLIKDCFSIGFVNGEDSYVGSICGIDDTDDYGNDYVHKYDNGIENCYYNKDIITLGGIHNEDSDSVKGLTTLEMTCGNALEIMGFDTSAWIKKSNDKTTKTAYYPSLKAFSYAPSVGYDTKLDFSAENADSNNLTFSVSALVKFDGMSGFKADSTALTSGSGTFIISYDGRRLCTGTVSDNTVVNVACTEEAVIIDNADLLTFTYIGTNSDYFANTSDVSGIDITNTTDPDDNFARADLDLTTEEIMELIPLSPEELERIQNGEPLAVYLVVIDYTPLVPADEKFLAESVLADGMEIGMYIDVQLFKQIGTDEPTQVTQTNGDIRITFEMPEKLINTDSNVTREYTIIRVHSGKASVLYCEYNSSTRRGSFGTDQFSTYAIAYRDTSAATKYPVDTGSSGLIKADKSSAEAGERVTISVETGYIAHVYDNSGNEIARISGTGSFIMPEGGVKITAEYPINLALTWQNSYIYSYDSGMNYITVNKTRKQGTITVDLGSEYAGKSFVIYEGKKSTKVKVSEGTLDKNGKFTLEVEDGKNYTLVIE